MFLFCFQITEFSRNQACSCDLKKHNSFDFAQQVHLPSNCMQPELWTLLYLEKLEYLDFHVPRKVGIFGVPVCCEGLPKR